MKELRLRPDQLAILQAVSEYGPVLVAELSDKIEFDRGTIEAAIGSLAAEGYLARDTEVLTRYTLTPRGKSARNTGLIERSILDAIAGNPVHMKDLPDATSRPRGEIGAGIGILKKAGLISMDNGMVAPLDVEKTAVFSKDLENGLADLDSLDDEVAHRLLERGLIEMEEQTLVTVKSKLNKAKIAKIIPTEEVTRLTPQMIATGDWRDVSFKPYSLKTKPRTVYGGRYQPYRQFIEHLKQKLVGLGFKEMRGPIVEQEFWNFDALYAPQDHSSREDGDILLIKEPTHGKLLKENYVKNVGRTHEDGGDTGSLGHRYKWDPKKAARLLLRPQGTAISARTLAGLEPPAKYFSVARCYRPDQIDATHAIEFNQTEGIICDPDITFRDLLGMLKTFAVEVAGASEVRFRPDYYPFTSPSVELSAKHPVLGYIEFGGAGIFRPEVTKPFGIDYPVLAWGLGVGRLFMTKYEISDIRELYSQNLDWLRSQQASAGMEVVE
ncbi:MAG: phenylalanine--tRNA ligase subunit alpha [Candidatus Kariarchaeaceae archaeon]|jgi:phenylalanyl-tRNA synthetase alpha chain